jgi:hypothetical protein
LKTATLCLLLMLAVCSLSLFSVPLALSQVNETQNIHIVSRSYYIDSLGNLVVVGEIQNVGSDVIDQVVVTGTAGDSNGAQSGSYARAWVAQLLPQQKAPFYMDFFPPQGTNGWYDVGDISLEVALANATSSYQYQGLTVTEASASVGTTGDYNGAYQVAGSIKNTGTQAATNITVVGTFFNSTNIAVGAGYTNYLSPRTLNPGESTSFLVACFDLNQSEVPSNLKITSYSLLVQTQGPLLLVQGTAPQPTQYAGSGGSSNNPTPTLAPGQTSQPTQSGIGTSGESQTNTIVYGAVAAIAIAVVAVAFLFLRRRRSQSSLAPSPKPEPEYKPKPNKRNRK